MSDLVIVALIVLFGNVLVAATTFITQRRGQPSTIRATDASVAQDNAETDAIKIGNDRTVYQAYKELLDDMAGVMRKQSALEIQVATLEGKLTAAEGIIADLREEIKRLRDVASDNAASRKMEAETASTLANTAATQPSTPASTDKPLHVGDIIKLEAPPEAPKPSE